LPSRTGTFRSARSRTRLLATSRLSRVRKGMAGIPCFRSWPSSGLTRGSDRPSTSLPHALDEDVDGRHGAGHDAWGWRVLLYRLPNRAAVSDIRLEKPHSLSYQPNTRASAPSTTAVCVASKVHDAGQWLKSTLTSGAVL